MNPLTQIQQTQRISRTEIDLGLGDGASWHDRFKHSAYVFCGGLADPLTEGDVLAIFSQYGDIVDLTLCRHPETGRSRGFAFLAYHDQRSTVLAVDNLSGSVVAGKTLRVEHVDDYKLRKAEAEGRSGAERNPNLVPLGTPREGASDEGTAGSGGASGSGSGRGFGSADPGPRASPGSSRSPAPDSASPGPSGRLTGPPGTLMPPLGPPLTLAELRARDAARKAAAAPTGRTRDRDAPGRGGDRRGGGDRDGDRAGRHRDSRRPSRDGRVGGHSSAGRRDRRAGRSPARRGDDDRARRSPARPSHERERSPGRRARD